MNMVARGSRGYVEVWLKLLKLCYGVVGRSQWVSEHYTKTSHAQADAAGHPYMYAYTEQRARKHARASQPWKDNM